MYSGIKPHALTLSKTNVKDKSERCVSVLKFCKMILVVSEQLESFWKGITSADTPLTAEGAAR